jgi:glycosyltransferase involved in cell wall biosynthesis
MNNSLTPHDGYIGVSVIIPTYNRAHTLMRAIDSVFAQTILPVELIIVDDGSSDATRALVDGIVDRALETKVIYHHQKNAGVSAARNAGVQQASCQWIALLDSDDSWLPLKLEAQVKVLQDQPGLRFVHGEEIWIRNGRQVNQMSKYAKAGGAIYERCLPLCAISPSAAMMHRSLFGEVGLFREDFSVCEDYDLWLKITARREVGFVEQPVVLKYGGHDDQLSRQFVAMDYWRVIALDDALQHLPLTVLQHNLTREMLLKKCEILLRGYERHNNMANYKEITEIRTRYSTA